MGKTLPPQQGDGLVCSPSLDAASLKPPDESFLEAIAVRVPSAFYLAMSGLGTGEIMRVASACSDLWRAVEGDQAVEVRYLVRLCSVRFGSYMANVPATEFPAIALFAMAPAFYL